MIYIFYISSLLNVWENIQCDEENDGENEPSETITLPESEDPYGGPNCICSCHQNDDEMYSSRTRHCIPCGTKVKYLINPFKSS